MRLLLIVCAAALFIALANLPIGYFTFLRILVTIGAVAVIIIEMENGLTGWVIAFGVVAIFFNPLFPIYLNGKSSWIFPDLAAVFSSL